MKCNYPPNLAEFQQEGNDSEYQCAKQGNGITYHPVKCCRIYLQKNDRCFNVRAGCGIHFPPRLLLAAIRGDGI